MLTIISIQISVKNGSRGLIVCILKDTGRGGDMNITLLLSQYFWFVTVDGPLNLAKLYPLCGHE